MPLTTPRGVSSGVYLARATSEKNQFGLEPSQKKGFRAAANRFTTGYIYSCT